MDNIAGSPVEGSNFFGREREVARFRELLQHHDILLLGPRRIGKTSLARALMGTLRGEGWRTIEINVASASDERGFLQKLEAALAKVRDSRGDRLTAPLAALGRRIKSLRIPIPGAGSLAVDLADPQHEWTVVAGEALGLIGQLEGRWLIYVDELPIFLVNILRADRATGVQRVRRFLDWFRNDARGQPGSGQVRWLISGSVGLDTLVQQHGMADTINSLKHQGLPPFTEEEAGHMLQRLASRYQLLLDAADRAALFGAIQWLQPYYLQVAFNHLRTLMAAHPNRPLASLMDQVVEAMAQPGADNDFHHWWERLTLQLPDADARHAVALLNHACATRAGAASHALLSTLHARIPEADAEEAEQLFARLRDILQRDAYWVPDNRNGKQHYRFQLEPLRRWWLRRCSP